jgi:hypothetical protein
MPQEAASQQTVADRDISRVMAARADQVKADVADWAKRSPAFAFDPSGSHLFSVMELAYSFAKRAHELITVIERLLASRDLVASVVLARALTETVGAGHLYVSDMRRLIAAGDLGRLEARFMKFYMGQRDMEIGPVHVLDALRHLEEVDNAYFAHLESRHSAFKAMTALLKEAAGSPEIAARELALRVSRNYALLSEVAHPNGLGTQFLYPAPGTSFDGDLRPRLTFLCKVAIWQCHHLVRALRETAELPEAYRRAFLPGR